MPALWFMDKSGRRALLQVGGAIMTFACLSIAVLGLSFETGSPSAMPQWVVCAIAAMILTFVASFACSWGPVVWCYCCEIFPLKYRGCCVGVTTTTNWIGNYLIAQFTPVLLDTWGFGTFFIFAG